MTMHLSSAFWKAYLKPYTKQRRKSRISHIYTHIYIFHRERKICFNLEMNTNQSILTYFPKWALTSDVCFSSRWPRRISSDRNRGGGPTWCWFANGLLLLQVGTIHDAKIHSACLAFVFCLCIMLPVICLHPSEGWWLKYQSHSLVQSWVWWSSWVMDFYCTLATMGQRVARISGPQIHSWESLLSTKCKHKEEIWTKNEPILTLPSIQK